MIQNLMEVNQVFYNAGRWDDGRLRFVKAPFDIIKMPITWAGEYIQAFRPTPLPDPVQLVRLEESQYEQMRFRHGDGYLGNEIIIDENIMGAWNASTDDGPVWGLHQFGWV